MKFIHTADWQLGKAFAGIADAHKRALVQQARIDAIERIGLVEKEAGASFVLVAGDLFDTPTADRATVSAACSAIGRIGMPVLAIPGNHDHGGPGSLWGQEFFRRERDDLAPNLTVLLEPTPYELDDAVILPCPLLSRTPSADPTGWLRAADVYEALPPEKPRIVLVHGSTQDFSGQWDEEDEETSLVNFIDLGRIPEASVDYIALGDWHGTKQVGPKAWYAGTPELDRYPKGSDYNPGNVLVVEARRGDAPRVTSVGVGKLRWSELEFDFAAGSADELAERLDALLERRTSEDLLRLTLSGPIGIESFNQLARTLESLEARLLQLKLTDRTRVAPTEEELQALTEREADPLISSVARQLARLADGDDDDSAVARVALRELYAACVEEASS